MTKIYLLVMFLFITGLMSVNAQVTIGSSNNPRDGVLLDLVANNKGVLFPNVELSKYNSLVPLITEASKSDMQIKEDQIRSIGMVVYNTNENADGIALGFVVWNGEEWQSMVGGGNSISKVSEVDCSGIEIKGAYTKDRPLDAVLNKLILPVTVNRKGSYNILVEVYKGANTSESNGYTFSANGEFHSTGKVSVTLAGQGTPKEVTVNNVLDSLRIYLNGQEIICSQGSLPGIKVERIQADYSLLSNSIKVDIADCVSGHVMTSDDQITARISVPIEAAGAFYKIETNTVNGISFSGSGILTGGMQNVSLYGTGTIRHTGSFTYTLTANNISSQTCTVDMTVMYNKPIIIKTYSSYINGDYSLAGDQKSPYLIANNPAILGTGTQAILPITTGRVSVPWSSSAPSNSEDYTNVALVLIGYNVVMGSSALSRLIDYVKQGGVAFICCESSTSILEDIVKTVNFVSSGVTAVASAEMDNALVPLVGNSPVVRGSYADLTGKGISRDGGGQIHFSAFPGDWEMVAGINGKARIIKHKTYDIYISGDGGTLAGGSGGYASGNPALVDNSGTPRVSTSTYNSGGYNSHLLANLILYAVQKQMDKNQ